MRTILTLLTAALLFDCRAFAQKTVTLQEAILHSMENSYAMNAARLNLASSEKSLEAIERGLMTSLDFEFDLPRYSRSLRSQFNTTTGTDEYYQAGYTTLEGRLQLNQPIIFTNGQISLQGSLFGRDQFISGSNAKRDYFSNLSFRLRQPLFGFNALRSNKEKAELNLERTRRNFTRSAADARYSVSAAFYDVFRTKKEREIAIEKVKQTESAYQTASNKFKAGLLAEVEALQLEVDLAAAKNELLSVETTFRESKNNFKITAGYPLDEDIDVGGSFAFVPISIILDSAVAYALASRTEIQNAETEIKLNLFSLEETEAKGRITGSLNASYGINRNAPELPGAFENYLDDRGVTFTLNVPLWDWGKNSAETEAADANVKNARLNAVNQRQFIVKEIQAVYNKFQSAKARVGVLAKSVEIAQKSYDISLARFDAGTITSFDLAQLQIRLTDAKLNSLRALIDYLLAIADIERKTLHIYSEE